MKSHARAPFAGSATPITGSTAAAARRSRGLFGLACLSVLGLVAFLGTGAPSVGAAESFPGQGFLPDNRAWEMVSPPDKNGGDVMGESTRTRAAVDGGAVGFASLAAFGDVIGTGIHTDYVSVRGSERWATHAITPFQLQPTATKVSTDRPFYDYEFSDDLSRGVFRAFSPVTDEPNVVNTSNLYLREDLRTPGAGNYSLLTSSVTLQPPFIEGRVPTVADASADFSQIILESRLNLTADAVGSSMKLYEWDRGTLRLAGILPDSTCGAPPCPAESSMAGEGAAGDGGVSYTQGTISDDGSRIFFTSPVTEDGIPTSESELYMRTDHSTTVQISRSEKEVPEPEPAAVHYEMATPDGGKVLFQSSVQLTDAPGAGLYMYDATRPDSEPDNLTLIATGVGESAEGVIGTSEDGSIVYFVSTAQLVPDASSQLRNIYRWENGEVRYVGSLETAVDAEASHIKVNYSLNRKTSRVTPDGSRMVFVSHSGTGLTGFAHSDACPERPCSEVYVYDAEAHGGSGELFCASCNAEGAAAVTDATSMSRGGGVGVTPISAHLNRAISTDGRFVFFNSGEQLVPADQNGTVQDVYAFDTVIREQQLISSGESNSPSYFLDASADGRDVFFVTRERLSGWDIDKAYDLYDARVGGGLPEPPPAPSACQGDACQPPPVGLDDPTPASSGFSGPGNPTGKPGPRRCPQGKRRVRRGGKVRCVKRKHKNRVNADRRASR